MRALRLVAPSTFEMADLPVPVVREDEALVHVRACGICGSDVHGMDGRTGRRIPPLTMGHEMAGEIVAVGSAVEAWKPGDRVTTDSTLYCGACEFCLRGAVNLCDRRRVLGVACAEFRQDGAFAEVVAVPARGCTGFQKGSRSSEPPSRSRSLSRYTRWLVLGFEGARARRWWALA